MSGSSSPERDERRALEVFGRILGRARNQALKAIASARAGKGRGHAASLLAAEVSSLTPAERRLLKEVVTYAVDVAFDWFLMELDGEDALVLKARVGRRLVDLRRASIGLPIEYAGDEGWGVKFSGQPLSRFMRIANKALLEESSDAADEELPDLD